jgi:hypothetical protein
MITAKQTESGPVSFANVTLITPDGTGRQIVSGQTELLQLLQRLPANAGECCQNIEMETRSEGEEREVV